MEGTISKQGPWWRQTSFWLLALIVVCVYFTRLTALPIAGEEARWGRGAVQMLQTGDWIVLRQQGKVFPERPPMSSWAMAIVGLIRGKVDDVALRLPSVIALLLTCSVIYIYVASFLSRFAALTAGLAYATFGQVLQIGRVGESEALFTFFLGSALLLWHLGYMQGWRQVSTWIVGYSLMAAAALVKGPQAPIYFLAAVGMYLLIQRRWNWIFSWSHAVGVAVGLAIVAAWQIPYYLATDWASVVATWGGLAGDRIGFSGLLNHLLTFPLETFGCLLPWSPLLLMLRKRRFRKSLGVAWPYVVFLMTAIVVTYPSLCLASGAKARYFMPLYPCFAALIGVIVERCVVAIASSNNRRDWNITLACYAGTAAIGGLAIFAISSWPAKDSMPFAQPIWFAFVFLIASLATAGVMAWACYDSGLHRSRIAVCAFAAYLGLAYTGVVVNYYSQHWNNARPEIAKLKQQLPLPAQLVSLGPVDHRFCYFYENAIQELDWPEEMDDVSDEITYFCMNRFASDGESKWIGRGRSWTLVPNRLPFAWEEVGVVTCERRIKPGVEREVVIGRIVRPRGEIAKGLAGKKPESKSSPNTRR